MNGELLAAARAAAEAGAAELRSWFRSANLDVRSKGADGLVTAADHASEAAIVKVLREHFPDHAILSEEGGWLTARGHGTEWLIDPLDGTTNFVRGLPLYAVAIACRVEGRLAAGVVVEPEGGVTFAAARGQGAWRNGERMQVAGAAGLHGAFLATGFPWRARGALDLYLGIYREVFAQAQAMRRIGAAALDLAYTAAGVYDGFLEFRLSPWDVAAGALLIEEAGGVITDLDGGDAYLTSGNVVAAGPDLHALLLGLAGRYVDEKAFAERLVGQPG